MNKLERIKHLYGKPQKKPMYSKPEDRFADLENNTIYIEFTTNVAVVNCIKRIHGKELIEKKGIRQYWKAPLSLDAIMKLKVAGFSLCDNLKAWEHSIFAPVVYDADFEIPGIRHFDYFEEYQIEGVQFIEAKNGRALIADDQGLGKTMQVLAWLQLRMDVRPVLVICPAIAKLTWAIEAEFWMRKPNVQVIDGREDVDIYGEIVIINYDVLTRIEDGKDTIRRDLWAVDWTCVVLDEAHYVTNRDSIRGWAVDSLVAEAPHVLPVTATPSKHRNKELFPLVNMVDNRIFPSWFKFAHRYCGPKKGYMGHFEFNGSSNEKELHELLTATIMLRRKKQDVFSMNDKVRSVVPLEITNRKEYDAASEDFESYLRETNPEKATKRINALQRIEALKQLAVAGKIKASIEWIQNLLESEEKVVVFADHKSTLDALQDAFRDISVRVDGTNTSGKKREEARQAFQRCRRCGILKERHQKSPDACKAFIYDMKKRVFLGSTAAITNITLTAAYSVVFVELWWSPKDHDQAEDRVYGRAGDVHGATCFYLIADNTIEDDIVTMYDLKNRNLTKVMDGKDPSKEQVLTELLKRTKGRK